jgi:hypothetical protein
MCPGVPTRVGVVQWSGPDNGAAPSSSAMRTRLARRGLAAPWVQGIALLVNAEPPLAEIPKDGEHPSRSLERLACGPERKIYLEILDAMSGARVRCS